MTAQWMVWLLTALTLAPYAVSQVPGQCPSLDNVCYYDDVAKLRPQLGGQYFAVGGLFDVRKRGQDAFSCGSEFNPMGILHTQAFLWSLNHWQSDSSSVSIGGVVFDSCERKAQMIQNMLGFEQCNVRIANISRHNVVGFVGPLSSMDAMAAAKLTGDMDLTLISPGADSSELSDANKYPFFLRTTPTIEVDIDIMAYMLSHVETEFVAVIYQQSQMASYKYFQTKMQERSICISGSYSMMGDESESFLNEFVSTTLAALEPTRYVALFLSLDFLDTFLKQVTANDKVKSMNLIFLMTSEISPNSSRIFSGDYTVAVSNAIVLKREEPAAVQDAVREFKAYWNTDTIQSAMAPRMSDPFLDKYLDAGNKFPEFDVSAAYTILATKAFVDGTRQAGRDSDCNFNAYLCPEFFDSNTRGSTIYKKIRSATNIFTPMGAGQTFANGDLRRDTIQYKIYRHTRLAEFEQLGEYTGGATPTITTSITGSRLYKPGRCQDSPCLQCPDTATKSTVIPPPTTPRRCGMDSYANLSRVPYPLDQEITGAYLESKRNDSEFAMRYEIGQDWIIALGVLAGVGILAVIIFEIYILYKLLGKRMGQKWRTMWLGQLLLFGILLCYLTLFAYLLIPTKATCGITRFGVGVSYSVCFAVLLVKLMVILTSTSSESSLPPGDGESPNYLRGIYQFLMFVFVVGVQVVIDTQWLITVPPEAVKVKSNNGERVWVCNHYTFRASTFDAMTDMASFVRSEFENHVLSLVYIMFLILITALLALRAHGIITNHREGVFIGIAAGFSMPIWLAWAVVGGITKDHDYAHEFGDACIAFGLFLTATLILFAMFLPKVRQLVSMGVEGIYFEDDHDTVYGGGSVIMAPSYKSHPNSVIYVNNQGIYSEPVVIGNGDGTNYPRLPGSDKPTPASTYSAPPTYLKKGSDSTRGGNVLRVTDDLSGRRPLERKRATSEVAYGTAGRARSQRGTLPRSRSQSQLGAL